MRISDWSSDVCSSDLGEVRARAEGFAREQWNRGERIVEKAAEAAKVEAERQGLTPEGMAKKAGKAVDAGKQAGEQAGKSEPGGQDEASPTRSRQPRAPPYIGRPSSKESVWQY